MKLTMNLIQSMLDSIDAMKVIILNTESDPTLSYREKQEKLEELRVSLRRHQSDCCLIMENFLDEMDEAA